MSRPLSPALQKLIASFKQALPEKLSEISRMHLDTASPDAQALQDYYTAVHRLAGSSGSYGFPQVSTSARVLDRYLADVIAGEANYVPEQAQKLLNDLAEVIAEAAAAD